MLKLKTISICVLVAVLFALVGWQETRVRELATENSRLREQAGSLPALRQEVNRLRTTAMDVKEVERLRGSERQLQMEVARLRNRVGSALKTEAETAQLKTELLREKQSLDANTNQLAGAMSMVKGMMEQQVDGQINRMKARLNLSPEQEQSIRDILMKQANHGSELAKKMLSGKLTTEEMADMAKATGNPEAQIKALLTPEQAAAYADYKQEESAANARLAANGEMLMMQNAVGLTREQQDQVFPVLYEQTLRQLTNATADPGVRDGNVATHLEQQLDQNVKALAGVLTPAQIEAYRLYKSNQFNMIKGMMPAFLEPKPGK